MKYNTLLLLLFFFTVSCQTIEIADSKFSCSELDWFEIGRSDGVQGQDRESVSTKKDTCQDFSKMNHESYVNGWYAGVDEFCSEEHGFAFGRSGHKYLNVCPPAKEPEFLASYKKGIQVFNYETKNQELSTEIEKINEEAQKSEPTKISQLMRKVNELETRLELNRALIAEIQRDVDESLSQTQTF